MNAQVIPEDRGESKARKRKSTRNPDHYYQRNATDFLDGTRKLSLAARGAYSDIIDLMYVGNGSVPDDDFWIACSLHVKQKQWKAVRPKLFADPSKLFIGPDGRIHNPRVDEEFSKRAAERLARSSRTSRRPLAGVSGDSAGNVSDGKDNDLNGGDRANAPLPTREVEVEVESEVDKKDSSAVETHARDGDLPSSVVRLDEHREVPPVIAILTEQHYATFRELCDTFGRKAGALVCAPTCREDSDPVLQGLVRQVLGDYPRMVALQALESALLCAQTTTLSERQHGHAGKGCGGIKSLSGFLDSTLRKKAPKINKAHLAELAELRTEEVVQTRLAAKRLRAVERGGNGRSSWHDLAAEVFGQEEVAHG